MTALEAQIRKVIVDNGFVKRVPGYPFPCLLIPKPLMEVLCQRLARLLKPDVLKKKQGAGGLKDWGVGR